MNFIFIAKGLLAIVAFMLSILSYVVFKFIGSVSIEDEKPDEFDITWSYVGKAMAGVLALMAVGLWYMVFAI
jgi:hypothetical protein